MKLKSADLMIIAGLALMVLPVLFSVSTQIFPPPEPVSVREITVSALPAESGFVSVQVRAYVESPRRISNATLQFRAMQTSGLLTQEREVPLSIEPGRTTPITVNLTLPDQDHKVEVVLFENGKMGARDYFTISGLEGLKSAQPIRVTKADASLLSVSGNRTTAEITVRLENTAREAMTDLKMELSAKDIATNLVTDRATVDVGSIGPRETNSVTGQVELVVGRSYDIEMTFLKNRTVVGEGKADVSLTQPKEATAGGAPSTQIQIAVSTPAATQTPSVSTDIGELVLRSTATPKPPGFEAVLAITALLAVWLYRRRNG
jgi:hypothetical protein